MTQVAGPGHAPVARAGLLGWVPQITEWVETFGDMLPSALSDDLPTLTSRLS